MTVGPLTSLNNFKPNVLKVTNSYKKSVERIQEHIDIVASLEIPINKEPLIRTDRPVAPPRIGNKFDKYG